MKTPTLKLLDRARRMGMTHADIAEFCGVHVITVSKWRAGHQPSYDTMKRLEANLDRKEARRRAKS